MAMKQNLQQEVAASLMEEQQILEDQQSDGMFDDEWQHYQEYCQKLEDEKREKESQYDDICDWYQLMDTVAIAEKEAV